MNWQELIVDVLNSNAAIATIAAVAVYLLNQLYAKKPEWKKYEGTVISAIKAAEKAIPDGSSNTATARLDYALKYVLKVYEETTKKEASISVAADFRNGIQLTHAELEAMEIL